MGDMIGSVEGIEEEFCPVCWWGVVIEVGRALVVVVVKVIAPIVMAAETILAVGVVMARVSSG